MNRLKNILVAVDFSPCSEAALRQASRIAASAGVRLGVLHVVPIPIVATDPQPIFPIIFPEVPALLNGARQRWADWAPAKEAAPGVTLDVVMGSARIEIVDRVHRDHTDLLVLGAHSEPGPTRGAGSTAAACVQRAATRVLLVREGHSVAFRSVVACVDFSETSREALELAIRTAALDNAALHVLHVYEDPWRHAAPPDDLKETLPDFAERYREAVEQRLRAFCEPVEHEITALKGAYHALEFAGHGKGIVDFVTGRGCDLAVLGTRAKWNLRDFLWGSTAERVVREAPCAVLTVKPEGFGAA